MNASTPAGGDFAALARRAHHVYLKALGLASSDDIALRDTPAHPIDWAAWTAVVRHVMAEVVALGAPAPGLSVVANGQLNGVPQMASTGPAPARIYIAGPMTGLPELNFPAFAAEAARLRALGYDVVNPAEINPDHSKTWHECMRSDIAQLVTCECICLLPGWEHSKGATLELHIAERLGMGVWHSGETQQEGSVA